MLHPCLYWVSLWWAQGQSLLDTVPHSNSDKRSPSHLLWQ